MEMESESALGKEDEGSDHARATAHSASTIAFFIQRAPAICVPVRRR